MEVWLFVLACLLQRLLGVAETVCLRRRVIGRAPVVVSVMRCALIVDVVAGRAYCAGPRMIASVRCGD